MAFLKPKVLIVKILFIIKILLLTDKNEYFEFRIEKTEISNQTILFIKDFAEKNEIRDQSQLWQYQVKDLFHRLGSN